MAGDGLLQVDEEAADDEIGHGSDGLLAIGTVGTDAGTAIWYCQVPSAMHSTVATLEPDTTALTASQPAARRHGQAVAEKGYADTTIADIVREAGVSRRTFYEHFATKAECLIALYEAASHNALKVLRDAIDPAHDWEHQVEQAHRAPTSACLASNPVLMRTLFIEILGLGPEGLAARRRVNQEIADFMLAVVTARPQVTPATGDGGRRRHPRTGAAGDRGREGGASWRS